MRTTVTLDADVAAKVKALARAQSISFKQALNEVARAGLAAGRGSARPFRQFTQPMRLRPGVSVDNALQLAAALEDDEVIRELQLRK